MRHILSLSTILVLLLLVGCAQSATPGIAQEESPAPATESTPVAAEALPETLLVYTREGGIAGFCDTLTVGVEEATWESCRGDQTATIPLDEQTRTQLEEFARRYAPLNQSGEDNPGGPDSLQQGFDFRGIGVEEPTEEAITELNGIIANILEQAATP